MSAEIPSIHAIYRYPVKGLSPEPLTRTKLAVGETLPADRLYAIENGPSGFDGAAPRYQPKQRYLMLMRNARLARLRTRIENGDRTLAIELDGREAARGDLQAPDGRAVIERFFAEFCAEELRGAPRVLHAAGVWCAARAVRCALASPFCSAAPASLPTPFLGWPTVRACSGGAPSPSGLSPR